MIVAIKRWISRKKALTSFISIEKEGTLWREEYIIGSDDYIREQIGKNYMSYLEPEDIIEWIKNDFDECEVRQIKGLEDIDDIFLIDKKDINKLKFYLDREEKICKANEKMPYKYKYLEKKEE